MVGSLEEGILEDRQVGLWQIESKHKYNIKITKEKFLSCNEKDKIKLRQKKDLLNNNYPGQEKLM